MLASRPPTPRCAAHGMTHPYSRSAHWDRGCVWGRGEGADQCMHWGIWPLRVSVSSIRGALDSLVFSSVSAALACGVFGVAGSCWVMMMMIGSIDRLSTNVPSRRSNQNVMLSINTRHRSDHGRPRARRVHHTGCDGKVVVAWARIITSGDECRAVERLVAPAFTSHPPRAFLLNATHRPLTTD